MIVVDKDVISLKGDIRDLCMELTYLMSGFKDVLEKEYGASEEDVLSAMSECCKIAFMNKYERKLYLDKLVSDKEKFS